MDVIHNERVKLLANLLNAMAGSSFAIGVAAPAAAAFFYGTASITVHSVVIGAIIWIGAAAVLHTIAQVMLGGLRS
jgi:hypothetical protein